MPWADMMLPPPTTARDCQTVLRGKLPFLLKKTHVSCFGLEFERRDPTQGGAENNAFRNKKKKTEGC